MFVNLRVKIKECSLTNMCVHNLSGKNHSADGDFVFQLESPVKLHDGKNYISLLSATVGLKVPNFLS